VVTSLAKVLTFRDTAPVISEHLQPSRMESRLARMPESAHLSIRGEYRKTVRITPQDGFGQDSPIHTLCCCDVREPQR
jgi:hypothetical protein